MAGAAQSAPKSTRKGARAWRSVQDRGERRRHTHKAVCFRVSLGPPERALSIVNALALAGPDRGFTVGEDAKEGRIVFAGHDAKVELRVTDELESKTRPRTGYDGKVEQEKYHVPTGRLRVTLQIDYREGPIFEDRDSRPLESQLNRALCGSIGKLCAHGAKDASFRCSDPTLEKEARQKMLNRTDSRGAGASHCGSAHASS